MKAAELKAPPTFPYLPPPGVVVSEGALGRRASQLPKPVTWKGPPPELQKPRLTGGEKLADQARKAPPPPPPPVPPPDGPGPFATFEALPPTLVAATLLKGHSDEKSERVGL